MNDDIYECILSALEQLDGKTLDSDDERDEVARAVTNAIKQWFANS